MVFYADSLLKVMPWWLPLVIDFVLGILAFYALLNTTIALIDR
jgi:hypothetical protein